MGISLLPQVTTDRMRGNGQKMYQGRVRLDIRKKLFTKREVRHWNKPPRRLVESLPLEVFKAHVDMALGNMVVWWAWQSCINN